MFTTEDALYAASILGITFNQYTSQEFLEGINIELEHGTVDPATDVTNDDLITTAKIALAHLNEYPNYYNLNYGIKNFERFLEMKLKEEKQI